MFLTCLEKCQGLELCCQRKKAVNQCFSINLKLIDSQKFNVTSEIRSLKHAFDELNLSKSCSNQILLSGASVVVPWAEKGAAGCEDIGGRNDIFEVDPYPPGFKAGFFFKHFR